MITFAPRFPATWLSETYARSDNLSRLICKLAKKLKRNRNWNCALGLKTTGKVFPYTDLPAGK